MTAVENKRVKLMRQIFIKLPIDSVYFYGSRAKGIFDSLSDYDFGILFSLNLTRKKRFDLRLQLFDKIARIFDHNEDDIDVVDLNDVPVLLQFNVISEGVVVYNKDDERRIMFETYVMGRYHDEHYYFDRYLKETLSKIAKGVYFERNVSYL